jgi:hypothetical protein
MFKKLLGICFFSIGYLMGGTDGLGNTIYSTITVHNDTAQPITIRVRRCDPGQHINVGVNNRGDSGIFMIILGNTGTGPKVHYRMDQHAEGLSMTHVASIAQFNVSSVLALRNDHVVFDNRALMNFPLDQITGQPIANPTFDYYVRWRAQELHSRMRSLMIQNQAFRGLVGGQQAGQIAAGAPTNNQGTNPRSTGGGPVLAGGTLGAPQNGIPAGNQPHAPMAQPTVQADSLLGKSILIGTACFFTGMLVSYLVRKKNLQSSATG